MTASNLPSDPPSPGPGGAEILDAEIVEAGQGSRGGRGGQGVEPDDGSDDGAEVGAGAEADAWRLLRAAARDLTLQARREASAPRRARRPVALDQAPAVALVERLERLGARLRWHLAGWKVHPAQADAGGWSAVMGLVGWADALDPQASAVLGDALATLPPPRDSLAGQIRAGEASGRSV